MVLPTKVKEAIMDTVEVGKEILRNPPQLSSNASVALGYINQTLTTILQYNYAIEKLEYKKTNELKRLNDEHNRRMNALQNTFRERNSSIEEAKKLIQTGIETNNTSFINHGIEILKSIIEKPVVLGDNK